MIYLFNNKLKLLNELSKEDLISADEVQILNGHITASISFQNKFYSKDISYFAYIVNDLKFVHKVAKVKNDNGIVYVEGIHQFFDEMQGRIIRDRRFKNANIDYVMRELFKDVSYQFEAFSDKTVSSLTFYHKSYLEAFYDIVKAYNCEFKIYKDRVIIKPNVSDDYGKWYEYGSNLVSIVAEENHSNVYTAFIGRGKGEESENGGYGRKIKFSVDGKDYIEVKSATEKFGYNGKIPRLKVIDFNDITNVEILKKETAKYAEDHSRPKLLLKSKVYEKDNVELGEIVTIIRDDIKIRYKTKIIKINRNLLSGVKNFEMGDAIVSRVERSKEVQRQQSEEIEVLKTKFDAAFEKINKDFYTEDSYDLDLKVGNKFNLPAGRYSFNKPMNQNPTKVTYMGAGKLLIANSKNPDGTWHWESAMDGDGIYGDQIISNSITANKLASDVGRGLDLSSNQYITSEVAKLDNNFENLASVNTIIRSKVEQNHNAISSRVSTVEKNLSNKFSEIKQTTDSITLQVKEMNNNLIVPDQRGKITGNDLYLNTTETLKAGQYYTLTVEEISTTSNPHIYGSVNAYDTKFKSTKSAIFKFEQDQTRINIYPLGDGYIAGAKLVKGDIGALSASLINLSKNNIKISADKVDINGRTVFNSISKGELIQKINGDYNSTTIDGGIIKTGSINTDTLRAGTISGWTINSSIINSPKLVFKNSYGHRAGAIYQYSNGVRIDCANLDPKRPGSLANRNYGVGVQISGANPNGDILGNSSGGVPFGMYLYKDTDFSTGSAPNITAERLLTVHGMMTFCAPYDANSSHLIDTSDWHTFRPVGTNISKNMPISDTWEYPVSVLNMVNKGGKWKLHANNGFKGGTSDLWIDATGTYSDRKIKENIEDSNIKALDFIDKLKFKSFDFKKLDDTPVPPHFNVGLIAQDVEEIDKDFVEENGDIKSLNDFRLLIYTMKAVQELSEENKKLKKEIDGLKDTLLEIRKELDYVRNQKNN